MKRKKLNSTVYIVLSLVLVIFIFSLILNLSSGSKVSFEKPSYPTYDDAFYVENYEIEIIAKNDRTFDINEKITVYYKQPRSVLLRDIPVNNGEKVRNVKVENGDYLSSYFEYGFYTLELGQEYPKITGSRTYEFSYTLITPVMTNYEDSLYLNIIGGGWPNIKNFDVILEYPNEKLIDKNYYSGYLGSNDNSNLKITYLNDNKVRITNINELPHNNALTVKLDYQEGYLTTYKNNSQIIIFFIISIIIIVVNYIIFMLFGTEDEPVEVVNFNPPYNLSPAELGYLIDNNCSNEDIVTMFFYFASKGYLKINEIERQLSFQKIKNIDNDPNFSQAEKDLFNRVFMKGNTVNVDDLTYELVNQVNSVRTSILSKYKNKLYNNNSIVLSVFTLIINSGLFVLLNYFMGVKISPRYFNFSGLVGIFGLIVSYVFGLLLIYNKYKSNKIKLGFKAIIGIIYLLFGVIYLVSLNSQTIDFKAGLILLISFYFTFLIIPAIVNRTPYYNEILGQIIGFKNFLATAEKERLEAMLEENPNYYYDILPYAQVLGVSDIWTNKFKNITLAPPTYYYSNRDMLFDIYLYNKIYYRANTSFRQMTMPKPSSNSSSGFGGGFGGGGFSGGGFGGGGGRSR